MMNSLLDRFVEASLISSTDRLLIESYALRWNKSVIHSILDCHMMSEEEVADAVARVEAIERITAPKTRLKSHKGVFVFSFDEAIGMEAIAVKDADSESCFVLAVDPRASGVDRILTERVSCDISFLTCERSLIINAILDFYPISQSIPSMSRNDKKFNKY